MARMSSIPALSHLNTLFPASKRRPQRVPERPEPNRDGPGPPLPVSPCEAIGVRKKAERESRLEALLNRVAPPLLTLLHLPCLPPHGVRSPKTPCPRQKRDRVGGEGGELKRDVHSPAQ